MQGHVTGIMRETVSYNTRIQILLPLIQCDVTMPISSDIDFHYIIHAASYAGPDAFQSDPVGVMKANIWGVDHLFSYGRQHHLRKFLYVSSGEVYGEGN